MDLAFEIQNLSLPTGVATGSGMVKNGTSYSFPTNTKVLSSQTTFPVRVHAMLAEIEGDPFLSSMVSWRSHGRTFVVEDRNGFMKHILPNWFSMKSFASFQRQCNMYGFKRMSSGPDKGGYYHELLLRGRPDLAARIPRQKFKGLGPRKPASPENEPNFYSLPAIQPAQGRSQGSGDQQQRSLARLLSSDMSNQFIMIPEAPRSTPAQAFYSEGAPAALNTMMVASTNPANSRPSCKDSRPKSQPSHKKQISNTWEVLSEAIDVLASLNEGFHNGCDCSCMENCHHDDFEPLPYHF